MSISRTLTVAEQQSILKSAKCAVWRNVKLLSLMPGFNNFFCKEDVEDIVGETVYRACRSFDRYNSNTAKITTWVSHIAFNCVNDARDSKMKRLNISRRLYSWKDDDTDGFDPMEAAERIVAKSPENHEKFIECSPEALACRNEFEDKVNREVGKLSEKNQRFVQYIIDGHKPKEMAELEGCSANAASKRVFDIRATLRPGLCEIARAYDINGVNFGR